MATAASARARSPRLFTDPSERGTYRRPSAREELISFETISLLLNWLQLGVLLVILFRLGHTFSLIANTQRELRRTIKRLGEQRATELNGVGGLGNVPSPRSWWTAVHTDDAMDAADLAPQSP